MSYSEVSSKFFFDNCIYLFITIINESDFPQLGVRWSPSFGQVSTSDGISAPVSSYGSVAGSSPVIANNSLLLHNPTSSHNPLFNRVGDFPSRHYASLIRDSNALNNTSEFRIQNEDFPALPAAVSNSNQMQSLQQMQQNLKNSDQNSSLNAEPTNQQDQQHSSEMKRGIKTDPDGLVTNIPPNMLTDQYGMVGFLTFYRSILSYKDQPSAILPKESPIKLLALGTDLAALGLNIDSSPTITPKLVQKVYCLCILRPKLYQSFGGPWAEVPIRIMDREAKVPDEYLINSEIKEKLPSFKQLISKLSEDGLFYLFYNCPGEGYQMAAATELYKKDWRFYIKEQCWLIRNQHSAPRDPNSLLEKYTVFDPVQWRKVPREMLLDTKLVDKPINQPLVPTPQPQTSSSIQQQMGAPLTNSTAQHHMMGGLNCGPMASQLTNMEEALNQQH